MPASPNARIYFMSTGGYSVMAEPSHRAIAVMLDENIIVGRAIKRLVPSLVRRWVKWPPGSGMACHWAPSHHFVTLVKNRESLVKGAAQVANRLVPTTMRSLA